jgi:tol-pal system protein YbgF
LSDLKVQIKTVGPENPSGGNQSPETMYNQAFRDFVAGNIDLAIQEFNAYIDTYPAGDKAPFALLYLGDAFLIQKKQTQANIAFTRVINNYPESTKVPSALYKRSQVELAMQETQNAINDLKSIIDKYPSAPEAENAKARLLELGVGTAKPAPPAITPPEKTRPKTR